MNLPLFLLKSLTKMENKIQTHPRNYQYNLFHEGNIKVLVIQELNRTQTPWEQFLVAYGFETQGIQKSIPARKSKGPKKTNSLTNKPKIAQVDVPSVTRETRSTRKKLLYQE
jgi:hypothetical protein